MVPPLVITDDSFVVSTHLVPRADRRQICMVATQNAQQRRKRHGPISLAPPGRFRWSQGEAANSPSSPPGDRSREATRSPEPQSTPDLPLSLIQDPSEGFRRDPFQSYPVTGAQVPAALDRFINRFCSLLFPVQTLLGIPNPIEQTILRYAMQHQELFAASLAHSEALLSSMPSPVDIPCDSIRYYRSVAITSLRQKIAAPNALADDAVILTTSFLMGTDSLLGATDARDAHRRALDKMVTSRGGIDKLGLDGAVKRQLNRMKNFDTLGLRAESSLSDTFNLDYPQRPLPLWLTADITSLPGALGELASTSFLSTQILEVLLRVSMRMAALNRAWHSGPTDDDAHLFSSGDIYGDITELLAIVNFRNTTLQTFAQRVEACVAAAMILFLFDLNTGHFLRGLNVYKQVRATLEEILFNGAGELTERNGIAQRDAMIWCSVVCCETLDDRGKKLDVFLRKHRLYNAPWSQVCKILQKTFWFKPRVDMWQKVWEDANKWRTRQPVLFEDEGALKTA